jgi:hypothetical protein
VPRNWAEDPPLGNWLTRQRECKKKLDHGDPNARMTVARVARLEALDFTWVCHDRRQGSLLKACEACRKKYRRCVHM